MERYQVRFSKGSRTYGTGDNFSSFEDALSWARYEQKHEKCKDIKYYVLDSETKMEHTI